MARQFDAEGNEIKVDEKIEKGRQAAFEQISKKAILINMVRRQITNLPYDVNLTTNVASKLGVSNAGMIQVRKFLFNPQHFSKIRSLMNDACLLVWNHTRPWDNISFRLLPIEYYDDFTETFGKIKDEFEEAVREFVDHYDEYVEEAKQSLGKHVFNKNDYPDKSQVASMFELSIDTANFPDIDDIRLNLSGPELVQMQEDIKRRYDDVINQSMAELVNILKEGDTAWSKKAVGLYRSVKALNIGGNPEIDMQLAEIQEKMNIKEPKELSEADMMVMSDIENDLTEDDDDLGISEVF